MADLNDKSSSEESSGGEDRWDPDILDTMDGICVFMDNGDEEEDLPELYDVSIVRKEKRENCHLCDVAFNFLLKKHHFCNLCGHSICDSCSNQARRLSKRDKKKYRICDLCDHKKTNS